MSPKVKDTMLTILEKFWLVPFTLIIILIAYLAG